MKISTGPIHSTGGFVTLVVLLCMLLMLGIIHRNATTMRTLQGTVRIHEKKQLRHWSTDSDPRSAMESNEQEATEVESDASKEGEIGNNDTVNNGENRQGVDQ